MIRKEDEERGLLVIDLDSYDPSVVSSRVLKFARMKYSGDFRCWVPDSVICMADYVNYPTKKKAESAALKMSFCRHQVERIGNRFCLAWGIRWDTRSPYFLAIFD